MRHRGCRGRSRFDADGCRSGVLTNMALADRTASLGPNVHRPTSRVGRVLALTLLMLAAVEAAVECRAYLRYGVTVFAEVRHQGLYVQDDMTGLRLLRPNSIIRGQQQEIR